MLKKLVELISHTIRRCQLLLIPILPSLNLLVLSLLHQVRVTHYHFHHLPCFYLHQQGYHHHQWQWWSTPLVLHLLLVLLGDLDRPLPLLLWVFPFHQRVDLWEYYLKSCRMVLGMETRGWVDHRCGHLSSFFR